MNSFKGGCFSTLSESDMTGHEAKDRQSSTDWLALLTTGPGAGTAYSPHDCYGGFPNTYLSRKATVGTSKPTEEPYAPKYTALVSPSRTDTDQQLRSRPLNDESVRNQRYLPPSMVGQKQTDLGTAGTISIDVEPGRLVKLEEDDREEILSYHSHQFNDADDNHNVSEETGLATVAVRASANNGGNRLSPPRSLSQGPPEQDKKMRREIANSNERRRMMCINNGFVSLQTILPKHYMKRGEKMSKAAVLQSTVDYISKLVMENAKLQAKNEHLHKVYSARLDSGGESSDEGISVVEQESDQGISSAKDLVAIVQHWREKYNRERCLRAQAIDEFRRLIADMQYCPAGCSKRETYSAALLRRSKSPTPDNDDDFMGPLSQLEEISQKVSPADEEQQQQQQLRMATAAKVDSGSQFAETLVKTPIVVQAHEFPVIIPISFSDKTVPHIPASSSTSSKRRNMALSTFPDALEEDRQAKPKALTGFEILYQAITFSENMDGHRSDCKSDSGCSEETFDSNEAPKKRPKHKTASGSPPSHMERVCS